MQQVGPLRLRQMFEIEGGNARGGVGIDHNFRIA